MGPLLSMLLPFSFRISPSVLHIRNFKQVSGPVLTAFSSGPQLERGHLLLERGANLRSTKLVHVKGKEKLFFIITIFLYAVCDSCGRSRAFSYRASKAKSKYGKTQK